MFVNTQQTKGFNKATSAVLDNEELGETEVVKQAFPLKPFLFACLCLCIALVLFILISSFSKLNPDPLDQSESTFSLQGLNYYIERNAPLRVPVINSDVSINGFAKFAQNIAIRFEDGRKVLLVKDLSNNENSNNYQIQMLGDTDVSYPTVVLPYSSVSRSLSEQNAKRIDDLLGQLGSSDKSLNLNIRVHAFRSNSASEEPVQEAIQKQDVSALLSSSQYPFRLVGSFSAFVRPLKNIFIYKSPYANRMVVSEPEKNPTLQEQKTAAPTLYDDFNRVSDTLLIEQVELVAQYLNDKIAELNINVSVNSDTSVRNMPDQNQEFGVVIEISQLLPNLAWENIETPYESMDSIEQSISFEIINQNIINLLHEDGIAETIAILPSALTAYYGNETDYSELSPQTYPSPLSIAILVMGIIAALYVLAYRQAIPDGDIVKKQLLVDSFVSDAPASNLSQDRLGFSQISSALSRFLRNAGTKAPLTLAITGAWGSGKSSLMYFLKENLLQFHMQPVWVNAWHHQNEEQFLAGLLSAIRRDAIPPFWTSAGLLYRWNLLKMRWLGAPFFYYSFAFIFLASLTFIITAETTFLSASNQLSIKSLPFFSAVIAAIPIVNAGMDRISRLSKASLIQTLLKGGRQSLDLRANIGLREKFATEFGMLCEALGDSTLTIFIDDLDRCKENRIMDVMETVNYLVSSGDCFIVLAMEREPVEKAIESYYKSTHSELDASKLKMKARRYLEKIINIEIPVPNANEEQFNALVKVKETKAKHNKLKWLKQIALGASLLVSIAVGHFLASIVQVPQARTEITANQNVNLERNDRNESQNQRIIGETEQNEVEAEVESLTIAQNKSQNRTEIIVIPLLFIVALGMLIRAERYRQRKRIVENDSEPFLLAISIWARVMGLNKKTPRSIKRFVNRTRFLAMRNAESETNIKEENLVTLAALIDLAKDRGFSNLEGIEQHLPEIENLEFRHQVDTLVQNCHSISSEKRAQLQGWIRGFNVS